MKDILDEIREKEIAYYQKTGLKEAINDFETCKEDRITSGFDERYEIGYNILTYNLENGVAGDVLGEKRVFKNFTDDNLKQKASELKASDVIITLKSDTPRITYAKELLENSINNAFDKEKVIQNSYGSVDDYYYFGWGIVYNSWDTHYSGTGMYQAGKPTMDSVNPISFYVNPGVQNANYKDNDQYFQKFSYNLERAKLLYPQIADKLEATKIENDGIAIRETEIEQIEIVRQVRRKSFFYTQRKIFNSDVDEKIKVTDWLEEEFQEFLFEEKDKIINNDRLEWLINAIKSWLESEDSREKLKEADEIEKTIDKLLIKVEKGKDYDKELIYLLELIAQQEFATFIFEDKIVAAKERDIEYRVFIETVFCPTLNVILQEPIIKKQNPYAIMGTANDPKTSYPISLAYKSSKLLNLHMTALTLQMLTMVRMGVPQLIIEPGAIVNESDMRKHALDPGFQPQISAKWRKQNQGVEPFYYAKTPDLKNAIMALDNKLERYIEEGDSALSVTKGKPSYSGQSGKAIMSLQAAAKQGDKTDLFKLQNFYQNIVESIKENLVNMLNGLQFKIEHLDKYGNEAMEDVNAKFENDISNVSDECYAEIEITDNVDAMTQKKYYEVDFMLTKGLITWIQALKELKPQKADKMIEDKLQYDESLQLVQMMENRPQVKEQVLQLLRNSNGSQETEPQENTEKSMPEQAL